MIVVMVVIVIIMVMFVEIHICMVSGTGCNGYSYCWMIEKNFFPFRDWINPASSKSATTTMEIWSRLAKVASFLIDWLQDDHNMT